MVKEDYKVKRPFKFAYTRPSLDWYEDVDVTIVYDEYNYLALERRYGGSWWVIGKKYIEDNHRWISEQIGKISEKEIPKLVEWAEHTNIFGRQVSILNEIRSIDGCLNPIREFLGIMSRYNADERVKE